MLREGLADLLTENPDRFRLFSVLSQETQGTGLFSGCLDRERLGDILVAVVLLETIDEWYLCDPSALVEAT